MSTLLIDDIPPDRLEQLLEQMNLRLAWRMRFSGFLHGRLSPAQQAQLQARCLRVLGPRWEQEIATEDRAWETVPSGRRP